MISLEQLITTFDHKENTEALYQKQLGEKVDTFKGAISPFLGNTDCSTDDITVIESSRQHYRLRAEFKIWHEGDKSHYAMTEKSTKELIFLEQFSVACAAINQLMPELLSAICKQEILRRKCFQIEFLSTLSGDTLVSLIYHKPLDENWVDAIKPIKERLGINIVGRSRKQKIVLDCDYVDEILKVNGRAYHYKQIEGGFTQPNGHVCEKMLEWAVNNSTNLGGDLLELYCGNGNFTLPLSQNFKCVVATEIAKTSVNAALSNLEKNTINNVFIARMSSEDFTSAMDKKREFRRLKDIDLESYNFSTVFVDPPRAGLDEETVSMVQRFEHIIYISCNPVTLIENLNSLAATHNVKALAAFDQFPYTDHLETGVILSKKP